MITIILILLTWYATKVYYTKTLRVSIYDLESHGMTQAKCSRCSQHIVVREEDMRTPFYCMVCK